MGKRIGRRGNCRGCSYFTKSLVVCKEEGMIVRQRPSDSSPELIAHKRRYRSITQIKVVPGIERGISVKLEQRSMRVITSRLGYRLDDATTIPAVLRTERLGQDADLRQCIQTKKKPGSARRRKAEHRIVCVHTVDENIRPIRTHTINRHLPGLAVRKQRRSAAGRWGNSRRQASRIKQI